MLEVNTLLTAWKQSLESADQCIGVSASTDTNGVLTSMQHFDAWGKKLAGNVSKTNRGFTGQYLDDIGLPFYNARYYDPGIGRFVSADTIVPGNASGGMEGIALKALTVDFHEAGFNAKLAQENQFGPWFTLSNKEKQQLGDPMEPQNPQALNRYSYTLNNPVRYVDPSGHWIAGGDSDNGYKTVCQDSSGSYVQCYADP